MIALFVMPHTLIAFSDRQIDMTNTISERKAVYHWLGEVIRATLRNDFDNPCLHRTMQLRMSDVRQTQIVDLQFPPLTHHLRTVMRRAAFGVFRTGNPAFVGAHTTGCWKSTNPAYWIETLGRTQDVPREIRYELCDRSKVTIEEVAQGMSNVKRKFLKRHQGRPWTRKKILACELGIVRGYMNEDKLIESRFLGKAAPADLQLHREIKAKQKRWTEPRPQR